MKRLYLFILYIIIPLYIMADTTSGSSVTSAVSKDPLINKGNWVLDALDRLMSMYAKYGPVAFLTVVISFGFLVSLAVGLNMFRGFLIDMKRGNMGILNNTRKLSTSMDRLSDRMTTVSRDVESMRIQTDGYVKDYMTKMESLVIQTLASLKDEISGLRGDAHLEFESLKSRFNNIMDLVKKSDLKLNSKTFYELMKWHGVMLLLKIQNDVLFNILEDNKFITSLNDPNYETDVYAALDNLCDKYSTAYSEYISEFEYVKDIIASLDKLFLEMVRELNGDIRTIVKGVINSTTKDSSINGGVKIVLEGYIRRMKNDVHTKVAFAINTYEKFFLFK